jgi:flagellar basal body-associated protein FliL
MDSKNLILVLIFVIIIILVIVVFFSKSDVFSDVLNSEEQPPLPPEVEESRSGEDQPPAIPG